MNIGFVGLGSMGAPMATNLLKAGHGIRVHDIDRDGRGARDLREAGALWADTPQDAATGAEVTFTSLPGPREVEAVVFGDHGVIEGANPRSVYVDLTTSSPTLARRIYKAFKERGVAALDAPVSQGSARAKYEGTLAIMVGGDEVAFERVKPVLDKIGHGHLIYCGGPGSGSICKIVNNLMAFTIATGLVEALTIGVKAGVPVETLAAVIAQSSGKSRISDGFLESLDKPRKFEREGPDGFSLLLTRKDVRLATDLGRELDVPLEIANIVEQKLTEAVARGWGHRMHGVHTLIQEEKAGVDLSSEKQRILSAGDQSAT
ncbi:MAG: NAD(P)-dependent oxidoreductase [Chloroflexi bacterium]|nr:NAD(P)-dependent oxidoreductase [Chloroflexota bacterium]